MYNEKSCNSNCIYSSISLFMLFYFYECKTNSNFCRERRYTDL